MSDFSFWVALLGLSLGAIGCVLGLWCKTEAAYWRRQYQAIATQQHLAVMEAAEVHVAPPVAQPEHEAEAEDQDHADEIRALYADGKSMIEIQETVYGYHGGQAYVRVKRILDSSTDSGTETSMRDA